MVFTSLKYRVFKMDVFTNKIKIYRIALLIILLLPFKTAISQISYETSKALLIYQFAKNISHQKHEHIRKYKICFLGNDIKTYKELKKITVNNDINGKPVELSMIKDLNTIGQKQLLYVDKSWAKKIEEVWFKIENENILLVTEHCPDAKYIMLNIKYNLEQETVSFEINKANIIIENFTINPEMLLLGGKEIDIRELYRDMKHRLEKEEQEVKLYKAELQRQTRELTLLRKEADSLRVGIILLTEKILIRENDLNYLADSIRIQQEVFLEKLSQIENQEEKLENYEEKIKNKEYEIEKVSYDLFNILTEKRKQKEIINEQKNTLSNQKEVITTKNRQLLLSLVLAFMLIVLAALVYYALNVKRKANKKQLKANRELESTLQKLTDTQSQLVQSEKMASLGVLTAGIAHEINNPVNYINSGLEGLKTVSIQIVNVVSKYQKNVNQSEKEDRPEDEKQNLKEELKTLSDGIQSLTKNIQNGVSRTTEIIKSLNTFSRIDNDELSLTNLHENINSTVTLLHNQYKNRIEIIKDYGKIPETYCYSSKLSQVFMNILSNAVQAIPEKGTIEIKTSYIEKSKEYIQNRIKISIKDNGTGIPVGAKTKVYEPFFTTKNVGKGTGLGLSITHGIIEQHNGSIDFASDSSGTEFNIYIPVILKK